MAVLTWEVTANATAFSAAGGSFASMVRLTTSGATRTGGPPSGKASESRWLILACRDDGVAVLIPEDSGKTWLSCSVGAGSECDAAATADAGNRSQSWGGSSIPQTFAGVLNSTPTW